MQGRSASTRSSASFSISAGSPMLLDIRRVADGFRGAAIAAGLGHPCGLDRDFAVEHVARDLQVGWPRRAGEGLARSHGDHIGDAFGAAHAGRELGDRRHDVDVGQVLQ
jgi:hypothetical protein